MVWNPTLFDIELIVFRDKILCVHKMVVGHRSPPFFFNKKELVQVIPPPEEEAWELCNTSQ